MRLLVRDRVCVGGFSRWLMLFGKLYCAIEIQKICSGEKVVGLREWSAHAV